MPYKDIEKRRECRRRWYQNNKDSEKNHIYKRKKEIKDWYKEYKSKLKCSKCPENHPATLDFHHKNSKDKESQISYLVRGGYSIERIKKELSKCQVLCSNCHRKEHHIQNKNL